MLGRSDERLSETTEPPFFATIVPERQKEIEALSAAMKLVVVSYPGWGNGDAEATNKLEAGIAEPAPYDFPAQLGREVEYDRLVRQLLRACVTSDREKTLLVDILLSPTCRDFVKDSFWYSFLEHFALVDCDHFVDRHHKAVAQKAVEDQQRATFQQAGLVRRSVGSRKDTGAAGKEKESKRKKARTSSSSKGVPLTPQLPRYLRPPKPRHLLSPGEAGSLLCPKTLYGLSPQQDDETASNVSHRSRSSSASSSRSRMTIVSMGSSASVVMERIEVEDGRQFKGRTDLRAVGRVLLAAGQLENALPSDITNVPKADGELYTADAIMMIRREQDAIVSRLATGYVEMFYPLDRPTRDVFLSSFPDVVARLVVQVLYRALPYLRELITSTVKQHIKRLLTYWVHGVEDGNIEPWNADLHQKKLEVEERRQEMQRIIGRSTAVLRRQPSVAGGLKPQANGASGEATTTTVGSPAAGTACPSTSFSALPKAAGSWKSVRHTIQSKVKSVVAVASLTSGDLSYAKGLEELRHAFEEMRKGTASPSTLRPGVGGSHADTARGPRPPGGESGGLRSRTMAARYHRRPQQQLERHAFFHRHAPINKKAFWNELGRPRGARAMPHGPALHFNLRDLSPLLQRYFRDRNREIARSGHTELMGWSA